MQFQAKDYFADWYRAKAPNIDNALIKLRIDAIDKILANKEKDFWIDLVKINLGLAPATTSARDKLISEFKNIDQTFPITENEDLIELLASIILCFKLETSESALNNQISSAIIISNFLGQFDRRDKIPVFEYAHEYISKARVSQRPINVDHNIEKIAKVNQSLAAPKAIADISDIAQINAALTQLQKNIVATAESSKLLAQSNKTLSEETNVLWWLIGGQSKIYKLNFSEAGPLKMICVCAKELSELTSFSLGVPSGKDILGKVLLISGKNKKEVSPLDSINVIPEEIKRELIVDSNNEISEITPLLLGIKKSLELNMEGWSDTYKQITNGDLKKLYNQSDISYQFYLEFLFLRLLK